MTRRVLLGTGGLVACGAGLLGAARLTHRLDDVADAVGLDPKPLPDPQDSTILRSAASETAAMLAMVEATASAHADLALADLETIGRAHLDALGGSTAATDIAAPPTGRTAAVEALEAAYAGATKRRAADAGRAFSPALVRVMASMSASHAQGARTLRGLR